MKIKIITQKTYDLFDSLDNFIRTGTKKDAMNNKLFTRSVHILLVNNKGEVMICKRSNTKRYPNQITSSAGGHVEHKENYKMAAKRELKEELGIHTTISDIGRFDVITKQERAIHHLFIGKIKKVFLDKIDKNEIQSFSFKSPEDIKKDLKLHPRRYCKPFQEAFILFSSLCQPRT